MSILTNPAAASSQHTSSGIAKCPWRTAINITLAHRATEGDSITARELACLQEQFPAILQPIQPGDLVAGRIAYAAIGFSPEPGGYGYFCHADRIKQAIAAGQVSADLQPALEQAVAYWSTRTTPKQIRAAYPAHIATALPSDNWTAEPGIAFPLYRMAGAYIDFDKLVRLGLPGLRAEIESHLAASPASAEFYRGLLAALDLVASSALAYAAHARSLASAASADGQPRLLAIVDACTQITQRAPATLHEGIQLAWIYALHAGVQNYGRMDEYLGDLLVADLAAGRLTREHAQALVNSLWHLIIARKSIFNGRVVLGGRGRRNEAYANEFALLAIEATRTIREIEPQLTLRFYAGQDQRLWDAAMRSIGEGRTYPMLYNDDINVPAVQNAFNVNRATAEGYVPFGCGEYVLNHQSYGTPNGVINLLKALEAAIFNGQDLCEGKQVGLQLGTLADYPTFDAFWDAYRRQVEYFTAALAEQEKLEYDVQACTAPCLLLSCLYDDCIARGRAIFDGGIRYLGGTIETYGNTNTADSLTAIKALVYDQKKLAPQRLMDALRANFAGHDDVRRLLLSVPKYGNDHPAADDMAIRVHEHICHYSREQANRVGLHSYLVVIINNWANTIFGAVTGASSDGRPKGEPMANANNPSGGSDKSGLTPMLNSLVKLTPTIHAGATQNMKFSSEMFQKHRAKLDAVLAGYFASGGAQAMITVLNRGDLEDAMAHPEKHANLMVRVGGFSARFVELTRKTQEEILSRTMY